MARSVAAACFGLFALMVSSAATSSAPAEKTGGQLFQYWCATCHGRGANMPGTTALEAKYEGRMPAALEDRADLTPEVVAYFVRHGVSIMPTFRKTEISDAELARIGDHLSKTAK